MAVPTREHMSAFDPNGHSVNCIVRGKDRLALNMTLRKLVAPVSGGHRSAAGEGRYFARVIVITPAAIEELLADAISCAR